MKIIKFFIFIPILLVHCSKESILNIKTIKNLKISIKGELTKHKKYAECAIKAKEEGYSDISLLFESLSLIEKQHADIYLNTLEKIGIKMESFEFDKYSIGSSLENFNNAINIENKDTVEMYQIFLKTAKDEKMFEAAKSFEYILKMENNNFKMLKNFSLSVKPSGNKKKATLGTTHKINF